MTEKQAIKIVQKHARYHTDGPLYAQYSLRWPETSARAIFADDTRKLVELLLEKSNAIPTN